ncbi:MAG: hypothetical protein ACM3ZB_05425 [bacterium]
MRVNLYNISRFIWRRNRAECLVAGVNRARPGQLMPGAIAGADEWKMQRGNRGF